MTLDKALIRAAATVESRRAIRPAAAERQTLPACPTCKSRMDLIRPIPGGSRVFRCRTCKVEHIL